MDYRREGGVSTASADDRLTKLAEEQAKKVRKGIRIPGKDARHRVRLG